MTQRINKKNLLFRVSVVGFNLAAIAVSAAAKPLDPLLLLGKCECLVQKDIWCGTEHMEETIVKGTWHKKRMSECLNKEGESHWNRIEYSCSK